MSFLGGGKYKPCFLSVATKKAFALHTVALPKKNLVKYKYYAKVEAPTFVELAIAGASGE